MIHLPRLRPHPAARGAVKDGAMAGPLAWIFTIGHGHAAQFKNFRDSAPPDVRARSEWFPVHYGERRTALERWEALPERARIALSVARQYRAAVATRDDWRAVFLAARGASYMWPTIRKHPTFIYVDSRGPEWDYTTDGGAMKALRRLGQRPVLQAMRGIVCMSEWSAAGWREAGFGDRVHVALPGANLHNWRWFDRSQRFASLAPRVLFVGGEFGRKGGNDLLGWAEMRGSANVEIDIVCWPGQLPQWVSDLLGNPGPSDRISRSLAPRLPHVRVHLGLHPNTPELQELYKAADLFCLPTRADFSSIATLEAMATGLPVVVGGTGGIPELVEDGRTGLVLEPGNLGQLSDALDELVRHPSRRLAMGRAARAACESYYNTERQVSEIVDVLDGATGARRPRRNVSSSVATSLPISSADVDAAEGDATAGGATRIPA